MTREAEAIRPGLRVVVALRASTANASPDPRITFVWGFFRKDAVLDVEVDVPTDGPELRPERRRFTEDSIRERGRLVQMAIDARHQHRPSEAPYRNAPFADGPAESWDAAARREALRGYTAGTIFI